MTRIRRFCFTWNNYPTSAIDSLTEWIKKQNATYAIIGREKGGNGTPHLQGYIMLSNQLRFSSIKKDFPTLHIEKARGTSEQNRVYCSKESDFVEIGKCPEDSGTVTKNIWKTIYDLAAKGEWMTLQENHPRVWIMMHEKLKSMRIPNTVVIQGDLINEWWFGDTGTGKSRLAWEKYGDICFQKMLNKWWDGYDHQPVVVIEEWSPKNEVTASALKLWADRYPFTAQIKGGVLQRLRPLKIIVISNYRISDCFPDTRDSEPIARRFNEFRFPHDIDQVSERADSFLQALAPEVSTTTTPVVSESGDEPYIDLFEPGEFNLDIGLPGSTLDSQGWVDSMSQADFDRLIRLPYLPEL